MTATPTISDLFNEMAARDRQVRADREKVSRQIRRLKTKLDTMMSVGARDVAQMLADQIAPEFAGYQVNVLGPFGLGAEVAIHIDDGPRNTVASISMRPTSNSEGITGLRRIAEVPIRHDIDMPTTVADLVADLKRQAADRRGDHDTQ